MHIAVATHSGLLKSHYHKTAHYHELFFPDITLFTPQRYYTFNVEATGRLGASACLFAEELYRASGRLWELDNLIGPSPIQSLLRDIVTVVSSRP